MEDVASGLNEELLSKLFDLVEEWRIGVAVVAFKDRFGFSYLGRCFSPHDVRIEVVDGGG